MSGSTPAAWSSAIAVGGQLRAQLERVALGVGLERGELVRLRRHEELEQVLRLTRGEVVRQPGQALGLPAVELAVALRVVARQDLHEVGLELLDVAREVLAVLEVELGHRALLRRHRERDPAPLRLAGDGGAVLLVDQAADGPGRRAVRGGDQAFEDDLLGLPHALALGRRRSALDAEQLGRERGAVVEGEDVEGLVVARGHGMAPWLSDEVVRSRSPRPG